MIMLNWDYVMIYSVQFVCARKSIYGIVDFLELGWHVYGLLYRSDKNYEEAMKCYRHALKYDKVHCIFIVLSMVEC